jgi:RNA polymerase-interacting CarD/CdnL/TRCF family regulator
MVVEVAEKMLGRQKAEYYVLQPLSDKATTLYVPTDSKPSTDKMRKLLSSDEIYSLLGIVPEGNPLWIENDAARKEHYTKILSDGDRAELIGLIKTLRERQAGFQRAGGKKRLRADDERFMKAAEKSLREEFAYVLKIHPEQVIPFILQTEAERE